MKLRSKILITALIPLLLSSSFAISRFISLTRAKEVELQLLRDLSGAMLENRISQFKGQAREAVRILAIPSETATAVLSKDVDFLYRWAVAFLGPHLDIIVITDRTGTVLARGHDEFRFGDSFAAHPAFQAMHAGLVYYEGLVEVAGQHYFACGVAIKLYGEKTVGYIVAGKRLDKPYFDSLGSELGIELHFPLLSAPGSRWLPGPSFAEAGGDSVRLAYRHPGSVLELDLRTATRDSFVFTLLLMVLMPLLLILILVLSLKPYGRLTALLQDYSNHAIGLLPLQQACSALAATADKETASLARAIAAMTSTVADTLDQLDARQQELEQLSRHDALTSLKNRRAIDEVLAAETARSCRYNTALSLIMLDIDNFKTVNDEHGHQEGDRVLQKTATTMQKRLRETDSCGRWGGEEFIAILPNTTLDEAALVAEAIRQAIEHEVYASQPGKPITASIGVAEFETHTGSSDLIRAADRALYRAKRSGKNLVYCADTQLDMGS